MESQQQQKIVHGAPLSSKCSTPIVKKIKIIHFKKKVRKIDNQIFKGTCEYMSF
jgi:hypothetical protein